MDTSEWTPIIKQEKLQESFIFFFNFLFILQKICNFVNSKGNGDYIEFQNITVPAGNSSYYIGRVYNKDHYYNNNPIEDEYTEIEVE